MRTSAFQFVTLLFLGLYVGAAQAKSGHDSPNDSPIPQWRIVDLGTLGGDTSRGFAINNRGEVAGFSTISPAPFSANHPFLYRNGTMLDLGTFGATAGESAFASDINDRGQVAGWGGGAYIWSNGTVRDIGTLGGGGAAAFGMNARGEVVGSSTTTGNLAEHAFLYSGGRMHDLGSLGGSSWADALNNAGQIVGTSSLGNDAGQRAFLYQNGAMTDLLGATYGNSNAYDINDRGDIVGSLSGPTGRHGFLYRNGTVIDLGLGVISGSINDRGQIVGGNLLISSDLARIDLNTLPEVTAAGWTGLHAHDINNPGWITGIGTINGQQHAFVLAPVPEPSTYVMLALGLLALTTVVRRRSK